MNVAVWIVQGLLAFAFLGASFMKLTQPHEKLQKSMPYVEDLPGIRLRLVGAVEFLAALGLILPGLTGIAPVVTPLAATGLAILMVGAALLHTRRKEFTAIPVNATLFILAVFVAWARFGPYPL